MTRSFKQPIIWITRKISKYGHRRARRIVKEELKSPEPKPQIIHAQPEGDEWGTRCDLRYIDDESDRQKAARK